MMNGPYDATQCEAIDLDGSPKQGATGSHFDSANEKQRMLKKHK